VEDEGQAIVKIHVFDVDDRVTGPEIVATLHNPDGDLIQNLQEKNQDLQKDAPRNQNLVHQEEDPQNVVEILLLAALLPAVLLLAALLLVALLLLAVHLAVRLVVHLVLIHHDGHALHHQNLQDLLHEINLHLPRRNLRPLQSLDLTLLSMAIGPVLDHLRKRTKAQEIPLL